MKVTVRRGASGVINLPESLMKALGLQDGDLIHVTVGAGALRLTRFSRFLELRGVLGDDEEFDRAMEFIQEAWKQWASRPSA